MHTLDAYPGWRKWQRSKFGYTLNFDDEVLSPERSEKEFRFSAEIDAQHEVVLLYLALVDTLNSLRDVEWCFRRYPFAGTPVTRYSHLTHCCELYFGRFYQFKERVKNLFDAIQKAAPSHGLNIGKFIKEFDKEFSNEIRARNGVHHKERFDDVAISRVFLTEMISNSREDSGWQRDHRSHYRKAAAEWARRTSRRANRLDAFVEVIAEAVLSVCPFLDGSKKKERKAKPKQA